MKKELKKGIKTALVLFMAVLMFSSVACPAQAKAYTKSVKKTITVRAYHNWYMILDSKKDCKVTMTVSTGSKNKNLNIQAYLGMNGVTLTPDAKKGSATLELKKGENWIGIINPVNNTKAKVKIKISLNKKLIKVKDFYEITDEG